MDVYRSIPFLHGIFQMCGYSQVSLSRKSSEQVVRLSTRLIILPYIMEVIWLILVGVRHILLNIGERNFESSSKSVVFQTPSKSVITDMGTFVISVAHITVFIEVSLKRDCERSMFLALSQNDSDLELLLAPKSSLWKKILFFVAFSVCYVAAILAVNIINIFEALGIGIYPLLISITIWSLSDIFICIRFLQFFLILLVVNTQVDRLYRSLEEISNVDGKSKSLTYKEEDRNAKRFVLIQDMYYRLSESVDLVMQTFGYSLLTGVAYIFYSMVLQMFWVVFSLELHALGFDPMCIVLNFLTLLGVVITIVTIAVLTQSTLNLMDSMGHIVHRIRLDPFSSDHNTLIEDMSHLLLRKPIVFSVLGCFQLDASIILKAAVMMTTYLVIIIEIGGL